MITARYIVELFEKHPNLKPIQGQSCSLDDQGNKVGCCSAAIISHDAGVDIAKQPAFPMASKVLGIDDSDDIFGLAYGFDGINAADDGESRASIARRTARRREYYLVGREAAELLGLPVPPLEPILTYFAEHPVAS